MKHESEQVNSDQIAHQEMRANNIQWTISENYNWNPNHPCLTEKCEVDFYPNIIHGGIHRFYNQEILSDFTTYVEKQMPDYQMFLDLLKIPLETGVYERLKEDRPLIDYYRNKKAQLILKQYDYSKPKDLIQVLELGHSQRILGQVPKINPMTTKLLNELENLATLDTADLVKAMNELYKEHFHFNPNLKDEEKFQEDVEEKRDRENSPSDLDPDNFSQEDLASQLHIGSAEFTNNILLKDFEEDAFDEVKQKNKTETNDEKVRASLEKIYGESSISLREEKELEKQVSHGAHNGAKLYITDTDSIPTGSYHQKQRKKSYEKNMRFLENHRAQVNREITRLSDKLKSTIISEAEEGPVRSYTGILQPSLIWRGLKMNDDKVFINDSKDNPTSIIVDLLVDGSASQQGQQRKVAIQAYILASALEKANITFRASSFQSQQGYTIVQDFLDYKDKKSPEELLHYYPNAANRDGFAIRLTRERMLEKPNTKNILIMLSDGRPNDKRATKKGAKSINRQYTEDYAVEDTAQEVRKLRQEEIPVLGVFTGKEEELEAAKIIYGSSFAYVKNIQRFSEIVSNFLKDEILRLQ